MNEMLPVNYPWRFQAQILQMKLLQVQLQFHYGCENRANSLKKKVFVENAKSNKDLRLINTSDVHLKSRKKKSESLIRKDVELFLYLKISKSIFKQLFTVTQILDDLHFIIFVSSIHGRVLW